MFHISSSAIGLPRSVLKKTDKHVLMPEPESTGNSAKQCTELNRARERKGGGVGGGGGGGGGVGWWRMQNNCVKVCQ